MQAATTDQFQFLDGLAAQQKQNRLLKVLVRKVTYGVCRFCSHFTNSVLNDERLGKENICCWQNLNSFCPMFKEIKGNSVQHFVVCANTDKNILEDSS